MMKHVIILVILLVISFRGLLRTPGGGGKPLPNPHS
ncbi:type I toxin-antitoxin system Ibs family toxin [Escherichia coli]|nr:type I toxin-antitoxin system Ibs family toxin [Escherichia coli]